MKTKFFTLLSLSVLALVMMVSLVSADAVTYTETFDNSELTGSYDDNSFVGDNDITWNYVESRDEDIYGIDGKGLMLRDSTSEIYSDTISNGIGTFSVKLKKGFTAAGNRQVELFINDVSKGESTDFDDDGIHTFTVNDINIEGDIVIKIENIEDTQIVIDDITWTEYTAEPNYCISGNKGEWIYIKRVKDEKIDNDNEWEWRPLDEIEITVEVENVGYDDKIRGTIEYGLYDEDDGDFIFEEEMDFSIKEDEKDKFTIEFKIDPTDLNEAAGDNDYVFKVKVYDDDDESETTQCKQFIQDVEIRREKDEITLEPWEIEILPKEVGCKSQVELTTTLFNIGSDDQDDVSVRLYNKELGITIMQEVGDIDSTESKDVRFAFTIPEDAEEKLYDFEIIIFDEDGDIYEIENHEGDVHNTKFLVQLNVEGNCINEPKIDISADLESEAKAGSELIVKVTIENTGIETSTFEVSPSDYLEWATLVSISSESVTLDAGESEEVMVTLNVNSDISGTQNFEFVVTEGTKVKSYQVPIMIEKASGFAGITGGLISEGNWPIWTIGAINVVLVFVIILVALKVAKKSA